MSKDKIQRFVARYKEKGFDKTIFFDKSNFDEDSAKAWMNHNGIKNFFFFFDPYEPTPMGENGMLFRGDIGFDITVETLLPHINDGKDIILNSPGGDLFEGWRIHDAIKMTAPNASIGVLGICASSAMQILLATTNNWMTPNSRGLIHNPWTFEAGDDDTFLALADDLKKEKMALANLYSNISGKSTDDILALMKKEVFLTADEMLEHKFVTRIDNNVIPIKNDVKPNDDDMKKEDSDKLNSIDNAFTKLINMLSGGKIKNVVVQDTNGIEIDFPDVETADQIAVGDKATVDGADATGDYVLADGTTYKFEGGELKEIVAPDGDDTEAMKQEIADLKAENETLKADKENAIADKATIQATLNTTVKDIETVKADFDTFKNGFSDEKTPVTPSPKKVDEKRKKFNHKK